MRISELINFAELHIRAGNHEPLWIWGEPGIGKSDAIRELAKRLRLRMIDRRAVTFDSVDVRGCPMIEQAFGENGEPSYKFTSWAIPGFLRCLSDGVPTMLFLDELAQAPAAVQAAFLQLTLDRCIDDYRLPDSVTIIAASNRQTDRAGVGRVITPLLSRFISLDLKVNLEDWQTWAVNAGIDVTIRAFLNFKPGLLLDFDPKSEERGQPSPRSWSFANSIVKLNTSEGVMHEVLSGTIGVGAASEYIGFRNAFTRIPDLKVVKSNPGTAPIPGEADPSLCYALIGKLTDELRNDASWIAPFGEYCVRFPKEFTAVAIRDAMVVRQQIAVNQHAAKWLLENGALVNGAI